MWRTLQLALAVAVIGASSCGDESEMPPPPDDAPTSVQNPAIKPIEFDPKRYITIKADRSFTIANLIFVVQGDPLAAGTFGITLTTSRPAPDGSRLTFGTIDSAANLDALTKKTLRFGGGSLLDPTGDGVFTSIAIYQPKFANLRITAIDKQEVRGVLSGEFYRFNTTTPTARPAVLNLTGEFIAARIDR